MAKIVKNKVTGMLGLVLVGFEDGTTDLVTEDETWDRWLTDNFVLVAEIDDLVIPPPDPGLGGTPGQQKIIAQAVASIKKFKEGRL